jgi:hypothetical protein
VGYVISAYAVTIGAVLLYWFHLVRERRRLAAELAGGAATPDRARE